MTTQFSVEYYCQQDEFLRYIKNEVNPAREKVGLPIVGHAEAKVCFEIIFEFNKKWETKA